jgi:hypothetical protein
VTDAGPSPFEIAAAELRKLGITLARLPGEYRVNFHNGTEATAQTAETVDAALDLDRIMAAERAVSAQAIGVRITGLLGSKTLRDWLRGRACGKPPGFPSAAC